MSAAPSVDLPGPRPYPVIGHLPQFRKDRLGFFVQCAREHGERVALRLGWRPGLLLGGPDDIEAVLTNAHDFLRPWYLRAATTVLGQGLIVSEGDYWRRQRRLVQPAFHAKRLAAYAPGMVAHAQKRIAGWQDGETRDVHEEMLHIGMEIVTEALFHTEPGHGAESVGAALEAILTGFDARANSLLAPPESWPTPANRALRRAVRQLDEIIYGFIRERRESGEDHGDLLSTLVRAQDEDGSRMTDRQLRDEAFSLFAAGHETTASAMSWIWYLLSENPSAEARLLEELDTVLGGRLPTVGDLPALEYTGMVIDEALRLFPPAFIVGREARHDCVVNGLEVRQGTTLLMSQWAVHRDPRFFPDPEAFRPERWRRDGPASELPRYAYFPFGGGQRLCIGKMFALTELKLLLATIAPRFELRLVPGHPVVPLPSFTLRPKHGMRMTIRRRGPSRAERATP